MFKMLNMTHEELKAEMRKLDDEAQNKFIDKLKADVDWLIEKSMKKEYKPTDYERIVFNEIRQKLENMNKWF